ncbi:hypothetical protein [Nocardia sp. NPDC052566]|uniref:hypothetical protein n=1 Tax=Nocardia sp. NPDC052566 TaxID=3364330 RepID=UPI0037C6A041
MSAGAPTGWLRRSLPYIAVPLGLVVIATVVILGMRIYTYGWDFWRLHHSTGARQVAEKTTVTGFTRTAIYDVNGNAAPGSHAVFIGPAPAPDPVVNVSVPGIQLRAVDPPQDVHPPNHIIVARGKTVDPELCSAAVSFTRDPLKDPDPGRLKLSPEQIDAVRSGTQILLEVYIGGCGWY